ncbi:hypothetical protein J4G37_31520 [Microvirga sp. 3-52]|nr:hypothetical protein [Microvirga sp. 3-52]
MVRRAMEETCSSDECRRIHMFDTSRTERLDIAAVALIASGETGRMRSTPSTDELQRCRAWHVKPSTGSTGLVGA